MIQTIDTYIITNGNGKQAVEFYCQAFSASLISIMYYKDVDATLDEEKGNLVLNAQLDIQGIRILLSDNHPNYPYQLGSNMSFCIQVSSKEEATRLYQALSVSAQSIEMELQETFFSKAYASFTDQFGVNWQINLRP